MTKIVMTIRFHSMDLNFHRFESQIRDILNFIDSVQRESAMDCYYSFHLLGLLPGKFSLIPEFMKEAVLADLNLVWSDITL